MGSSFRLRYLSEPFPELIVTNLNGAFFTVNSAAPLSNDNGASSLTDRCVHVVAPGATKTPIWKRGARASPEESAKLANFVSSVVLLGHWGQPQELANAVLFLVLDDSSYINALS